MVRTLHSEMTFGDDATADGEHLLYDTDGNIMQKRVFNNGVITKDTSCYEDGKIKDTWTRL